MARIGYGKIFSVGFGDSMSNATPQKLLAGDLCIHTPLSDEIIHSYGCGHLFTVSGSIQVAVYDLTLSVESAELIYQMPTMVTTESGIRTINLDVDPSSEYLLQAGRTYAVATKCNSGTWLFWSCTESPGVEYHSTATGNDAFPDVWGSSTDSYHIPPVWIETHRILSTKIEHKKFYTLP